MGLAVVPLSYLTVWELVQSNVASFITALLMICDTGTLILSQYILLDPPLLCFVMLSTFCTARFINCRKEYVFLHLINVIVFKNVHHGSFVCIQGI